MAQSTEHEQSFSKKVLTTVTIYSPSFDNRSPETQPIGERTRICCLPYVLGHNKPYVSYHQWYLAFHALFIPGIHHARGKMTLFIRARTRFTTFAHLVPCPKKRPGGWLWTGTSEVWNSLSSQQPNAISWVLGTRLHNHLPCPTLCCPTNMLNCT